MSIKKAYKRPEIQSEMIQVGVFGSYGSSNMGVVRVLAPLFGICCGG
jgi:hypothetical protein